METEILWPELKNYLISSRDCHFLPFEAQLEPQSGELCFDFSSIPNIGTAEIIMRKISGNGEAKIEIDDTTSHQITSRKKQPLSFDLFFTPKMKIYRPLNSIGKIAFSGIRITDDMAEKGLEWKRILREAGEYSKLYLRGEKLFAKQGGSIQNLNISKFDTLPSNAYQISGNKFVFLTGCEISKIELKKENISSKKESYISHVDLSSTISAPENAATISLPTIMPAKQQSSPTESRIVFHSQNFNFLRGTLNSKSGGKIISSSGLTYLALRSGGEISFSIPELQEANYILIFKLKKLNGNGKFLFKVLSSSDEVLFSDAIVADAIFREKNIFLKGSKIKKGNKFSISMPSGSAGEILISKIMIINDFVPLFSAPQETKQKSKFIFSANEEIRKKTQNFSVYDFSISNFLECPLNYSGIWRPCGWRAKQLTHKFLSFAPKIKIYDDALSIGTELTNQKPDLTLGEIDFFHSGERVYIFSWPENYLPSEEEKKKLNSCQMIVTSSLNNYFWLKSNISSKIEFCNLHWPKLDKYSNTEGQFYFAVLKNKTEANKFYTSWPSNAPPIYILGGTENISSQFINLSECLPYDEIFAFLASSQGVIQMGNVISDSKFLSMISDFGLPILTNNTFFLNNKIYSSLVYNSSGAVQKEKISTFLQLDCNQKKFDNQLCEIGFYKLVGNYD